MLRRGRARRLARAAAELRPAGRDGRDAAAAKEGPKLRQVEARGAAARAWGHGRGAEPDGDAATHHGHAAEAGQRGSQWWRQPHEAGRAWLGLGLGGLGLGLKG